MIVDPPLQHLQCRVLAQRLRQLQDVGEGLGLTANDDSTHIWVGEAEQRCREGALAAACALAGVQASPIAPRAALDVYVPHIETPNSQTAWIAGQTANVTW